ATAPTAGVPDMSTSEVPVSPSATSSSAAEQPVAPTTQPTPQPEQTAPPSEPQPSSDSMSPEPEPEEPRGPTPATASANFPFPQTRAVGPCTLPTNYRNSHVVSAFEKWKADTVTAEGAGGHLRVKRLESDPNLELGSTVSE